MRKELLKGLTEEQIEKASKCKNSKELLAAAKKEGIELSEEQLKAVNGGGCTATPKVSTCSSCGAQVTGEFFETTPGDGRYVFKCTNCGNHWIER